IVPAPGHRPSIVIRKAVYGVPGDPKRTRDVREKVQQLIDRGEMHFPVARLAAGDDPAHLVVKTLDVDYTADGQPFTVSARDPQEFELMLPAAPERPANVERDTGGRLALVARQAGTYVLTAASGRTRQVEVAAVPGPRVVSWPWVIQFAPGRGAPGSV